MPASPVRWPGWPEGCGAIDHRAICSGLSVITANVAAYFVVGDVEDETDEIDERLDRIEARLAHLTALLSGRTGTGREPGQKAEE